MSIKVMSWVWDCSTAKGSQHHVLLAIADCSSDDGGRAYPSISELCRKTRLCERTVQQAIKNLVKIGELFVTDNGGPRGCNQYRVIMSAPPQDLHPAEYAPPQDLRGYESDKPARKRANTPADSAPPQILHPRRFDTPSKSGKPVQALANTPQDLPPADSAPPQNLHPEPSVRTSPPYGGRVPKKNTSKIDSEIALRPDVEALCDYLADRIEQNGYLRPTITKKWRADCRIMIDTEGRAVDKIRKAIEWATSNDFWRPNIRSMAKLREHYDTMADRALQEQRRAQQPRLRESSVDGWGPFYG